MIQIIAQYVVGDAVLEQQMLEKADQNILRIH